MAFQIINILDRNQGINFHLALAEIKPQISMILKWFVSPDFFFSLEVFRFGDYKNLDLVCISNIQGQLCHTQRWKVKEITQILRWLCLSRHPKYTSTLPFSCNTALCFISNIFCSRVIFFFLILQFCSCCCLMWDNQDIFQCCGTFK